MCIFEDINGKFPFLCCLSEGSREHFFNVKTKNTRLKVILFREFLT